VPFYAEQEAFVGFILQIIHGSLRFNNSARILSNGMIEYKIKLSFSASIKKARSSLDLAFVKITL